MVVDQSAAAVIALYLAVTVPCIHDVSTRCPSETNVKSMAESDIDSIVANFQFPTVYLLPFCLQLSSGARILLPHTSQHTTQTSQEKVHNRYK